MTRNKNQISTIQCGSFGQASENVGLFDYWDHLDDKEVEADEINKKRWHTLTKFFRVRWDHASEGGIIQSYSKKLC